MKEIKDENTFLAEVANAKKSVLVMFSQQKSPLCQKTEEVLISVIKERPELEVVKVDIDNIVSLASRYMVTTPPAIIAFKEGKPREKIIGLVSKREVEKLIQRQFS